MRRFLVALISALAIAASSALATASDNGRYVRYSVRSCGDYLEARKNSDDIEFLYWIGGYITGLNYAGQNTYDILASTDLKSAMAWLENYCRSNPLNKFQEGAERLTIELYPKRQVKTP